MHKLSIITSLMFLTVISSQAQHFGIKAGVNYSGIGQKGQVSVLRGDTEKLFTPENPLIGANFGFFTQFDKNKIQIQPELLFSMQGFNSNGNYRLNYALLPVLIGYEIAPNFKLQLGGQVAYLLNKKTPILFYTFEKFDYSALIGAQYKINNKISINLRYAQGLNNIYPISTYADVKTTNQNIHLNFQYNLK